MGARRTWLRVGVALWLLGATVLAGIPMAVASVPPLDGAVPCLQVGEGPVGPGSTMEEPGASPAFPLSEPQAELLLPTPVPMEWIPHKAFALPPSLRRLDRPPTP